MKKINVAILGATGMVGQRLVQLLENHPWFEVTALAASDKSAGKRYQEAVAGRWKISSQIPVYARHMKVQGCKPNLKATLVFSALDSSVAGPIELQLANAGYVVCSNSKNHRMEHDVPLLIPEVNPDHLEALKMQKQKGFMVTNPNCSTIHLVLALKPLHDAFGIKKVIVTTMQALSGAGYPGVASMDILDNVVPYISGEEEKMEMETNKILGSWTGKKFVNSKLQISAHCNRVNVLDGHLETVSIAFDKKTTIAKIKKTLQVFNPLAGLNLPSSPKKLIDVRDEPDRPQPRFDRMTQNGMAGIVGRIRTCSVLDYRFVILGHNTIRGAAGAAILNAELMVKKGYIGGK